MPRILVVRDMKTGTEFRIPVSDFEAAVNEAVDYVNAAIENEEINGKFGTTAAGPRHG